MKKIFKDKWERRLFSKKIEIFVLDQKKYNTQLTFLRKELRLLPHTLHLF